MTDKPQHTPGPWIVYKAKPGQWLVIAEDGTEDGTQIAECRSETDAARIVACVNALENLNPAAVRELVEAADRVANQLQVASSLDTGLTAGQCQQRAARLRSALRRVKGE